MYADLEAQSMCSLEEPHAPLAGRAKDGGDRRAIVKSRSDSEVISGLTVCSWVAMIYRSPSLLCSLSMQEKKHGHARKGRPRSPARFQHSGISSQVTGRDLADWRTRLFACNN